MIAYGVLIVTVVSIHLFALMASTFILPSLEIVDEKYLRDDGLRYRRPGDRGQTAASRLPHAKYRKYIATSWVCSTGIGIILWLTSIGLVAWIKFHSYRGAAVSVSALVVTLVMAFCYMATAFYVMVGSENLTYATPVERPVRRDSDMGAVDLDENGSPGAGAAAAPPKGHLAGVEVASSASLGTGAVMQ